MPLKRLVAVLCLGCSVFANLSVADQQSFEQAVNVYMKGFKECVEAHATRSQDIAAAKRKYQAYLTYKEQATSIDQSILTSNERSMQKNLSYCEKAYENILRAEAEPILETGLAACDLSKSLFESGDMEQAKIKIDLYEQQHTEAVSITESILEAYALASRTRGCNRLKLKIAEAEEAFRIQEEQSQHVIGQLIDANTQCEVAKELASNPNIQFSDIDVVDRSLAKAKDQLESTKSYKAAYTSLQNNPTRDSSIQIKLLSDQMDTCTQSVNAALKTVLAKKSEMEKTIGNALITAQKAKNNCQAGRSLLEGKLFQFKNLDTALWYYNETQKYRKAAEKQTGASLAGQYPNWAISKDYTNLTAEIKKCEKVILAQYQSKAAEFEKHKEAINKENATRQKRLLEEKRNTDEAKLKELEQERQMKEAAKETKSSTTNIAVDKESVKENEGAADQQDEKKMRPITGLRNSWTDLVDDPNDGEDDLFDDEDEFDEDPVEDENKKRSSSATKKSWTDLVPNN